MSALEYVLLRLEVFAPPGATGSVDERWRFRIARPDLTVSATSWLTEREALDNGSQWLAARGYLPAGHIYPNSWCRARAGTSELLLAARAVVGEEAAVGSPSLGSMNRLLKAVEEIDAF